MNFLELKYCRLFRQQFCYSYLHSKHCTSKQPLVTLKIPIKNACVAASLQSIFQSGIFSSPTVAVFLNVVT